MQAHVRCRALTPPSLRLTESGVLRHSVAMRRLVHATFALVLAFISLWPGRYVEAHVSCTIKAQDLSIHVVSYAVLAALTLWAYGSRLRPLSCRTIAASACSLFGALMEVLQATLPGVNRNGTVRDALHNVLGVMIGVWLPRLFWPPDSNAKELPHDRPV